MAQKKMSKNEQKSPRSYKSPGQQTRVRAKWNAGQTKTQIAKEEKLSRNTVRKFCLAEIVPEKLQEYEAKCVAAGAGLWIPALQRIGATINDYKNPRGLDISVDIAERKKFIPPWSRQNSKFLRATQNNPLWMQKSKQRLCER